MKVLLKVVLISILFPISAMGQGNDHRHVENSILLIGSSCMDLKCAVELSRSLRAIGIEVSVVVGPSVLLARAEGVVPSINALPRGVTAVYKDLQSLPEMRTNNADRRIAYRYFERTLNGELEQHMLESSGKMNWNHLAGEHALVRGEDQLKNGGSSLPDWTCSNGNNSEDMRGCILASTFFSESDGSIDTDEFDWTQTMIDDVKLQIIDSWSIWSYTASLYGHTVTAVMNWYDNTDTVANTSYEPIRHSSGQDHLWINEHLNDLGYTSASKFTNCDAFNHDMRMATGSDHAVSCFMIANDPAQGAPNSMTDGKIGYAYLGGPYTQMMYKANGWGTNQVYRVYGHEIGHIFHAFDEYSSSGSYNCTRQFNGVVNSNYQGAPCNGSQGCVMINNSHTGSGATRQWRMCDHTPDHLGWEFLLPEPTLIEPLFNETLTSVPVRLEWDRDTVIPGTYGYVKIWDRSNDSLVLCQYSNTDTLMATLINGDYKWRVSSGGGYAGVVSDTSYFSVNAPLNADFSYSPSTLCAGQSVFITDLSSGGPNHWEWHFPGGSPSMHIGQDPPSVVYSISGTYDLMLIVNDGGGGADTLEILNALTVTGGRKLPLEESFENTFPPNYWSLCCGGTQGGPNGLNWDTLTTGTPGFGTSAIFDNYHDTLGYAWAYLNSPEMDITSGDSALLIFDVAYAFAGVDSADALYVSLHNCNYSVNATPYWKSGDSLATNGGVLVSDSMWYPTEVSHWRRDTVDITPYIGNVMELEFINQGQGGQSIYIDNVNLLTRNDWQLDLKVFLEGPYDDVTGLMNDDLRINGLIPLTEPYTALGYGFVGGGGETIDPSVLGGSGPSAIVDWVIVELRDIEDQSVVIASRAALLQRDGSVVDLDGISLLTFNDIWSDWYYVAIRHRSHLGIVLALGNKSTSIELIDLTSGFPPTWPIFSDSRKEVNGTYLMWAGDVNFDGIIKYTGLDNDRDPILSNIGGTVPTAINTGYFGEDVNMNGEVKYTGSENDRDIILQNIGGAVPTDTRTEHLP